jgi:hypothetical protein
MAVMEQLLGDLESKVGPNSTSLTDYDMELAQIDMDPDNAYFHPRLFKIDREIIEQDIDAIYVAASAGDDRARFLIHAAAMNQVVLTEHISANNFSSVKYALEDFQAQSYANTPKDLSTIMETLSEIDHSLAIIEVAIEDSTQAINTYEHIS